MTSSPLIGRRIGEYRIDAVLGEGGMGVVFRGMQEALGQLVAIKMLHPNYRAEDKVKSRFIREAQALARLNHPNIVRLYNFIDLPEGSFIVMEYAEGRSVDKIMGERGLLPPAEAGEIYVQVLAAMHYAHGLGVIHRDIKPSNILVLPTGHVKVLDFGTAKIIGTEALTRTGMTLGTLVYMSPEQVCGRPLDHRSDIYSLGVTLYEMVTARLPHEHENEGELMRQIVKGTATPPTHYYKFLPKHLEKIIIKAIEKDPARRFQTAEEFLADLKAFIAEEKTHQQKRTPPSGIRRVELPLDDEVVEGGRRQTFIAVGVAVALLGLAAGLVAIFTSESATTGIVAIGAGFLMGVLLLALGLRGAATPQPAAAPAGAGPAPGAAPAPASAAPIGPIAPPGAVPAPPDAPTGVQVSSPGPAMGLAPAAEPAAPGAAGSPGAPWSHASGAPSTPVAGTPAQAQPHPLGLPPLPQPSHLEATVDSRPLPPQPPAAWSPPAPVPVQAAPAPAQLGWLYILDGQEQGRAVPLGTAALTIGRGGHNALVLSDAGVSTAHAQIAFDGVRFLISDLQSRNGTYVNNQRIARAFLKDRDIVVVGTTRLAVQVLV